MEKYSNTDTFYDVPDVGYYIPCTVTSTGGTKTFGFKT